MTPSPWAENLHKDRDPSDLLRSLASITEPDARLEEAVVRLLDHPDCDVREEALRCVGVRWSLRPYRAKFASLLTSDPDDGVRATAAFALMSVSDDETLIDDTKRLRSVVLDELEDVEVRMAAYESLLLMYQKTSYPQLESPANLASDIDWNWVHGLPA